ncbi:hypothetical protein [Comamonas thiooxydans]|uniref:hypothetical protein n=1 Tax=Comamonas thiooxydans TaxID=363952 RepID=UPI003D05F60A
MLETLIAGQTPWALISDLDHARRCVSALGGAVCTACDPADVLESQYQGVALLGTLP